MSGPFIVMSRSRVKPGRADSYAAWSEDFFRDVEEQEPRLLAFNMWGDGDSSSVVIQVHPDAESFEYHLKLFGERVGQGILDLDVDAVELYGAPTPFVAEFAKHGMPGLPISVQAIHQAGFTRLRGV